MKSNQNNRDALPEDGLEFDEFARVGEQLFFFRHPASQAELIYDIEDLSYVAQPTPVVSGGVFSGPILIAILSVGSVGAVAIYGYQKGKLQSAKTDKYYRKFDEHFGSSIQVYLKRRVDDLSWWDQPRWQNRSFAQYIVSVLYKPCIPESKILIHDRALSQIRNYANKAYAIDSVKLKSQEFIVFLKLRRKIQPSTDSVYGHIQTGCQRLKSALVSRRHFESICQIEMQYLGFKQQQVYQYVNELLADETPAPQFRVAVKAKLNDVIPSLKTQDGRDALFSYGESLAQLSNCESGLELLGLFKKHQLSDYVVLRNLEELFSKWKRLDLSQSHLLMTDVRENFELLKEVAPIILWPTSRLTPEDLLPLVHYMVLEVKHQSSYEEFLRLTQVLQEWHQYFQVITGSRQGYYSSQYRIPTSFKADIPGIEVYEKYASYLSFDASDDDSSLT